MSIDKARLARSFNRSADAYRRHSQLQQGISRRLLSMLRGHLSASTEDVLDLGCGSGFSSGMLARHLAGAKITAVDLAANMVFAAHEQLSAQPGMQFVCADMENLPFSSACFDLVFSSSAIQWSDDRRRLVRELQRVLRPRGLLCLSSFGRGTLSELRSSWARVDAYAHVIDFEDPQELSERLGDQGFKVQFLHRQTEFTLHENVTQFLRSLKKAGISNCRREMRCAGLTTPRRLTRMKDAYQSRYAFGSGIRASYDVFFILARKE